MLHTIYNSGSANRGTRSTAAFTRHSGQFKEISISSAAPVIVQTIQDDQGSIENHRPTAHGCLIDASGTATATIRGRGGNARPRFIFIGCHSRAGDAFSPLMNGSTQRTSGPTCGCVVEQRIARCGCKTCFPISTSSFSASI